MNSSIRNLSLLLGLFAAIALAGGIFLWQSIGSVNEAQAAPPPEAAPAPPEEPSSTRVRLRLALAAAFVSESGAGVYKEIAGYLTSKTGIETEFVSGLAYGTISSMLEDGTLQAAFICGLPYTLLRDRPQPAVQALVAPVMKAPRYQGQPRYFSDLIVRRDSPYQTIHDLKGKTFAYNDELSNSGYNMPRHRLLQLGLTQGFFGKILRSGSHEESIRMVAAGEADVSFVDSLVLDFDRDKGFGHAREVRVIESLGPAGIGPLVASSRLPAELRDRIQHELVHMHETPEGRRILDQALLDRFVSADDHNYDGIRAMREAADKAGFMVIR